MESSFEPVAVLLVLLGVIAILVVENGLHLTARRKLRRFFQKWWDRHSPW